MWRLYCGEKEGIALQTTFAELERSLKQALKTEPLLVGKIQYGNYETMQPFTEALDHVMYKREGFSFEQEVRVLRSDEDHYNKLCNGIIDEKLSNNHPIPWDIKATINSILISPYVGDWYLEAVSAALRCIDTELESRVGWSKLQKAPAF